MNTAGVVGPVRHADAIAEQRSAGERALRVARQNGDGPTLPPRTTSINLPINVLLPTPPLPVTAMTLARFADAASGSPADRRRSLHRGPPASADG